MPELEAKTNTVTLLCSERLKSLFRRSFPNIHVEARVEPLSEAAVDPQIDFQMSLADLGLSLRPNVDSCSKFRPNTSLIADTEMVKSKRAEYRDMANGRPLVGISWKSKAPDIGPLKSANLDLVTSLIEKSNVAFVCLQYEPTQDELETLAAFGPPRWLYDASIDPMDNIDHAAVQVAALDYVVTVSNTTVHLSGALGIPTTLLVPPATGRHWYWPRGTEQSLWYNSVRLLETQNSPSWHDRIEELAKELAALEVS